jgi:hypothetical protein
VKSLLAQHGLKPRNGWVGFSSAAERHKANRWRLLFCIGICGLAVLCLLARLLS